MKNKLKYNMRMSLVYILACTAVVTSCQPTEAATVMNMQIDPITSSVGFHATPVGDPNDDYTFNHVWNFNIPETYTVASSITTIKLTGVGGIYDFNACFNTCVSQDELFYRDRGVLGDTTLSLVAVLGPGNHTLQVSGINKVTAAGNPVGSYGGNLTVVSAVPVPGAVWLFGSALFGIKSLSRRRAK